MAKVVMKLKSVHTYQYVRFQLKNENFLCKGTTMPDLELELLEGNIVSARTAKDHILIFNTNIAYCVPLTEETTKRGSESRGQMADIVPSSPRK